MAGIGSSAVGRFGRRARDAGRGVWLVYGHSGNARLESLLGYLALSAALSEGGTVRLALVGLTTAVVLAAEAMNTAMEWAIDRVGLERHPLAGAAKDSAAGAVLFVAAGALAVGCWLLVPEFGLCLAQWRRAALSAQVLWGVGLGLLVWGVLWPERRPRRH